MTKETSDPSLLIEYRLKDRKDIKVNGTFEYCRGKFPFTNIRKSEYLVTDVGVDSLEISLFSNAKARFKSCPSLWRQQKPKIYNRGENRFAIRTWSGPKVVGAYLRFQRSEWDGGLSEKIILNCQPDAVLGFRCRPAGGMMVLTALRELVEFEWMKNAIGEISIDELTNSSLTCLEEAVDIAGLSDIDLDDFPISFRIGKGYSILPGDGYERGNGKSSKLVVYRKGNKQRIEMKWGVEGINYLFERKRGEPKITLVDYLSCNNLAQKLCGRLNRMFRIEEKVSIVSTTTAALRLDDDQPKNIARWTRALGISRKLAHHSPKCRKEYEWQRKQLKDKYGWVIGSRSLSYLVIDGLAEAIGNAYEALQAENNRAYLTLSHPFAKIKTDTFSSEVLESINTTNEDESQKTFSRPGRVIEIQAQNEAPLTVFSSGGHTLTVISLPEVVQVTPDLQNKLSTKVPEPSNLYIHIKIHLGIHVCCTPRPPTLMYHLRC
jgi:hypothetical protein